MSEKEMTSLSENVCRLESKDFYITGAIWRTQCVSGDLFDTYEIGVRSKFDVSAFTLIQPNCATEQNIEGLCKMVKTLLDGGFTPIEIRSAL